MSSTRTTIWLCAAAVLLLSYFTYMHNYVNPQSLFWDENYHVASAQKYLNGTYFMEPHPPLGKLLIAAGEALIDANPEDDQFIGTDYAQNIPDGFSFAGYRFFPTLLGWLTAPVLFAIFLVLTRHAVSSMFLSFLYVFDTALIVHNRSAMLDSTMLFFSMLTVLGFLLLIHWQTMPGRFAAAAALFGVAFAGVMTTKVLGLVLILLVPALLVALWPRWREMVIFAGIAGASFFVVYVAVWQVHFSLGRTIHPGLPDDGYYQASETYKRILDEHLPVTLGTFPMMLRDSVAFLGHYSAGVPRLDLSKEDENGSPAFLWPVGARTISYRWEAAGSDRYRYLYLVSNPVGWMLGLFGVLGAAALLFAQLCLPLRQPLRNPLLLLTFLSIDAGYLLAVSRLDRVMYLYHYLLPLLLSFLLFSLVLLEIPMFYRWKITEERRASLLLGLGVAIFLAFQWIRPLAYYVPMTDEQVGRRNLLQVWEITCARCERNSPFVVIE